MASAMRVFRKFRASDGRIKIATLSGVSVLVAVIAMLVGVLPVMADHETSAVEPDFVQYGGGPGACDFVDSAAGNELHINNPTSGPFTGPDGTEISITVSGNLLSFDVVTPGIAVYDVVINGGPHNNHYDYDGKVGLVTSDVDLHAPRKSNGDLNNLSHTNICYDAPVVTFECGGDAEFAFRFGDGISGAEFTEVTARIFTVGGETDCTKEGIFFINNEDVEPTVKLDFGSDGPTVVGRADFTKVVEDMNDLDGLRYDPTQSGDFVEMQWCSLDEVEPPAAHEFDDVLETDEYPSLDGVTDGDAPAIACKVYEEEDASGFQYTVVYFEFEDPQFK